jgi:polyhydroxybutyrate depolymerase
MTKLRSSLTLALAGYSLACSAETPTPSEQPGGTLSASAVSSGAPTSQSPSAAVSSPSVPASASAHHPASTSSTSVAPTATAAAPASTSVAPLPTESAPSVEVPSSTPSGTTPASTASGPAPAPSEVTEPPEVTCPTEKLAPGQQTRMIETGGKTRSFILYVPTSYQGDGAVPLLLDFHALGGTGSGQMNDGMRTIADQEGFIIAYPNGIDNAWDIGPCCTNSEVDDLAFALSMVATISEEACIDPTRVYASGTSMGGGMSMFLACNAADTFAAVAPAAFDLLIPEEEPCAPSRPISVIAFRGTEDTVVPFAGGKGPSGKVTFLGAQGSFERWLELNGCTGTPAMDANGCSLASECDADAEVALCIKQGGGHANGDARVAWDFLMQHTLPR